MQFIASFATHLANTRKINAKNTELKNKLATTKLHANNLSNLLKNIEERLSTKELKIGELESRVE